MNRPILRIVKQVLREKPMLAILVVLATFGSIVSALLPPLALEKMVNNLADDLQITIWLAGLYILLTVIAGILESAQNITITVLGQRITHAVRGEMCRKIAHLPSSYFTDHEAGKISSRFVTDVDAMDSLFTNGVISMAADFGKMLGILVVVWLRSPGLGVLLLAVIPLIFVMTWQFKKKMRRAQLDNREAVAKVNNHVPETIRSIRMIRNLGCQDYMENKYEDYIEEGYHAMDRSNFYDSVYSPIILTISALVVAVMMAGSAAGEAVSSWFGITVGSAVAIIAYVGKVFTPIESIGMEIQNIQSAFAGMERIEEFLCEEEAPVGTLSWELSQGTAICFDHVRFGYDPSKPVWTDLSFTVNEGEKVTLMGRTGCGKSTAFKLLLGLYSPDVGNVTIGGIKADQIAPASRRKLYGYVEQQFTPVPGTIADQITLFDPSITLEMARNAAKICSLDDKIMAMKDGYLTPFTKAELSQGEIQLLSIARAVAAEPGIMLLDEITSDLDSVSEKQVLAALSKAAEGRTVLSISHRLSGITAEQRVIEIGRE